MELRHITDIRFGHRAWTFDRIEAWRDDTRLGHITVCFLPREKFEEEFPDVEAFAAKRRGFWVRVTDEVNPKLTLENDREELETAFQQFEEFHVETAHFANVVVKEPYRRQGICNALFIEGAKLAGSRHGMKVANSAVVRRQDTESWGRTWSDPAWKKLAEDPEVPTVTLANGLVALDYTA